VRLRNISTVDCAHVMSRRVSAAVVLTISAVVLPLLPRQAAVAASPPGHARTTAQVIRLAGVVPGSLDRRGEAEDAPTVRGAVTSAQAAASPVDAS